MSSWKDISINARRVWQWLVPVMIIGVLPEIVCHSIGVECVVTQIMLIVSLVPIPVVILAALAQQDASFLDDLSSGHIRRRLKDKRSRVGILFDLFGFLLFNLVFLAGVIIFGIRPLMAIIKALMNN